MFRQTQYERLFPFNSGSFISPILPVLNVSKEVCRRPVFQSVRTACPELDEENLPKGDGLKGIISSRH